MSRECVRAKKGWSEEQEPCRSLKTVLAWTVDAGWRSTAAGVLAAEVSRVEGGAWKSALIGVCESQVCRRMR